MRAPLAGTSAAMPSPEHDARGAERPRASTEAATGGNGGGAVATTGAAGTGAASGAPDEAPLGSPGRARTRGQKAGARGKPAAALRWRNWRRRLSVT